MLMTKGKINITLDKDLIEYAKIYAEEQRTSVSEIFTQFILNLKQTQFFFFKSCFLLQKNNLFIFVLNEHNTIITRHI